LADHLHRFLEAEVDLLDTRAAVELGMTSPSRPVSRETLTVQITGRLGSASAWRRERGRYMAAAVGGVS
jgi:hypothetical protein